MSTQTVPLSEAAGQGVSQTQVQQFGSELGAKLTELVKYATDRGIDLGSDTLAKVFNRKLSPATASLRSASVSGAYETYGRRISGRHGGVDVNSALAFGGCDCNGVFFGAADLDLPAIRHYGESGNERTKDNIVNSILATFEKLGIKGRGANAQEKLKSIRDQIPATFKASAHKQVVEKIAKSINDAFGSNIVDASQPVSVVGPKIAEVIYSLTNNMHAEYLIVYGELRTTIQNLHILDSAMKAALDGLAKRLAATKSEPDARLLGLQSSIELALQESRRQLAMLEGLLNTTVNPEEKRLSKIIGNSTSLEQISKLAEPGDKDFNKTIVRILDGLGITATVGDLINNALKKVGITLADYAKISNVEQLYTEAAKHGLEIKSDEEMNKYIEAVKFLVANLYRAADIADRINNPDDAYRGETVGAADDYGKSFVEKQIDNRKNLRAIIFSAFNQKIKRSFNTFVDAIDMLSNKIGVEVPVTSDVDGFRTALGRVDSNLIYRPNIYYALIGFYNDAYSKSLRDEFIADLKTVKVQCEILRDKAEFKGASHLFAEIIKSVDGIIALIDDYSGQIAVKFGAEEHPDPESTKTGAHDHEEDNVEPEGITGAADILEVKPVSLAFANVRNIHDAVVKLDYKFRVAQIRRNLATVAAEREGYTVKYESMTQDSIFNVLREQERIYNALRKELSEGVSGKITAPAFPFPYNDSKSIDAEKAAAIKMLDNIWDVKRRFWSVVADIDSYMQAFTDGLARSPEDIADIKSMLDGVEIIQDWYTDATGETIASVFESFPGKIAGGVTYSDNRLSSGPGHYYERIGTVYSDELATNGNADSMVIGNPHLVADPVRGQGAQEKAKKMFEKFSILKNFIGVFMHIGSKANGVQLKTKVNTPTQLYNALADYISVSAFAQGYDLGKDVNATDNLPVNFAALPVPSADFIAADTFAPDVGPVVGYDRKVHAQLPVGFNNGVADESTNFRQRWGIWMRSICDALVAKEQKFGFELEDQYFVHTIKAMAAKIFTVTGLYDVFDRPLEFNGLSQVRMIIGGDEYPVIDNKATPLYLRLVLLAQFYRKIFSFVPEGDDELSGRLDWKDYAKFPRNDTHLRIALVPDLIGVFGGLIKLLFRKIRSIEVDNFTDDDIRAIVGEVNTIYKARASEHKGDPVGGIIQEFITEVNRRYAIVSKAERDTYEEAFGATYDRLGDEEGDRPIDIPLLEGEGEPETQKMAEFQRRLEMKSDLDVRSAKKSAHRIEQSHYDLVKNFRCIIDNFFESPEEQTSFDGEIMAVGNKLKVEQNSEKRFKLIASLIRGSDSYTKVDGTKYLMFHETVVAQLNVLSGIHTLLSRTKLIATLLDPKFLRECIVDTIGGELKSAQGVAHSLPSDFAAGGNLTTNFQSMVVNKLMKAGLLDSGVTLMNAPIDVVHMVEKLCGRWSTAASEVMNPGTEYFSKPVYGHAGADRSLPVAFVGAVAPNSVINANNGNEFARVFAGKTEISADSKDEIDTFYRLFLDQSYMYKLLVETLFGVVSQLHGTVTMTWDKNSLSLNFGGVKTVCTELLESASYFIEVLRPQFDKDFVSKYTDKKTPGSLYWLQEQITEKILEGRAAGKVRDADGVETSKPAYDNLEKVAQRLASAYRDLTKSWEVDGAKLSIGQVNKVKDSRNVYSDILSEMVFYDASKPESGLHSDDLDSQFRDRKPLKMVDFSQDPYEALHFHVDGKESILDTRYINRFTQLYDFDPEMNLNRSALFVFNQLIAKFIRTFYDTSNQKLYSPLLSDLVNGVFNHGIVDHAFTYPDTSPAMFVKGNKPEALPASNVLDLQADMDTDMLDRIYIIKRVLETYLRSKNAKLPELSERLNGSSSYFSRNIASNGVTLNRFIVTLTAFFYGVGIADHLADSLPHDQNVLNIVGKLIAAKASTAATVIVDMNGMPPNVANSILAEFGTSTPSADQIADLWINNIDVVSVEIYNNHLPPAANIPIMGSKPLIQFNDIDSLIKSRARTLDLAHSNPGIIRLLRYNPYKVTSESDIEYVSNLVATMIFRYGNAANGVGATDNDLDDAIERIVEKMRGAKVYVPPTSGSPKFEAKKDDVMYANDETSISAIGSPLSTGAYIVLARNEAVGGVAGSNSIDKVPGSGPKNVASSSHTAIRHFGQRFDADADHVLFTSLAHILRNLYNSKAAIGKHYLNESIADVAIYMKDKFRANLPEFKNLFLKLRQRCEFIKKLLEQKDLNMSRDGLDRIATHNPWPYALKAPVAGDVETKSRFIGILDTITSACSSMIQSCEQVLREVGDTPKYFELHSDSIKDYKNQYNEEPLMLLSSALHLLQNASGSCDILPVHSVGEEKFKFAFGIRSLISHLGANVKLDSMPGMKWLFDQFDQLVDPKMKLSSTKYDDYLKAMLKGLQFIYESKHLAGSVSSFVLSYPRSDAKSRNGNLNMFKQGIFTRHDLVVGNASPSGAPRTAGLSSDPDSSFDTIDLTNRSAVSIIHGVKTSHKVARPVYAIGKSLADVIRLTESSDRDARIRDVVEWMKLDAIKGKNPREIQNIIDLNVVPIDVHALRREIPLVNLYNYSYTFDRMIVDLYYGLRNDGAKSMINAICNGVNGAELDIGSARDMLVTLLINPYIDLRPSADTANAIERGALTNHLTGMLVGEGISELGRPKFLSDQIFNKVVFGELYKNIGEMNEVGPAAVEVTRAARMTSSTLLEASVKILTMMTQLFTHIALTGNEITNLVRYIIGNPNVALSKLPAFNGLTGARGYIAKVVVHALDLCGTYAKKHNFAPNSIEAAGRALHQFLRELVTEFIAINANAATFDEKHEQLIKQIEGVKIVEPIQEKVRNILNTIVKKDNPFVPGHISLVPGANAAVGPLAAGNVGRFIGVFLSLFGQRSNVRLMAPADNHALHWMDFEPSDNSVLDGSSRAGAVKLEARDVSDIGKLLTSNGRMRFDTKFIRNLTFIVNIVRSVRLRLQRDLVYDKNITIRSAAVTRNPLTEFTANEVDAERAYVNRQINSRY